MGEAPQLFLKYSTIRELPDVRQLRAAEVPIEHAVSLALPTCRWQGPGYVQFAAPAIRSEAAGISQAKPDRWWVIDARTGQLLLYALIAVHAPDGSADWATFTLASPGRSAQDQGRLLNDIGNHLDALAEPFFTHQVGAAQERQELSRLLNAFIPEPLGPQYRCFASDFFRWLNA